MHKYLIITEFYGRYIIEAESFEDACRNLSSEDSVTAIVLFDDVDDRTN